ncbi:hypothetical protein ASPSYDRAFT_254764 [Aspergillus sydowii CBS 593.65]|uniref:Amino acid permease/ SLC12A domain-containing protein n=1 Tax=Aspergillus sydowii CBS 593.65 TaxID=1036612 RepID=A0A1L9TWL4_9EURO|nr:uncharacterized protein ASPSYDRAFT_254764 [Aspergillus sydowii CBS 593.65]OJJ63683.1 hypothetical protein ASPSYDRAFT_254764 [Aspergillus sydowii CBS 593.65]
MWMLQFLLSASAFNAVHAGGSHLHRLLFPGPSGLWALLIYPVLSQSTAPIISVRYIEGCLFSAASLFPEGDIEVASRCSEMNPVMYLISIQRRWKQFIIIIIFFMDILISSISNLVFVDVAPLALRRLPRRNAPSILLQQLRIACKKNPVSFPKPGDWI